MRLAELRSAAIDRALVGDDPRAALALAGAADISMTDGVEPDVTDSFAAAMLAVTVTVADRDPPLAHRAWHPGSEADPLVRAGAAAAVRTRDISLDRAATLADCPPTAVEKAVKSRY